MADYLTRAKQIVANIKSKDQTIPSNTFLKDIGSAYVYAYRGQWEAFIASSENTITSNTDPEKTVVNPSNTIDPTDIGVLNAETNVFTPITNGPKNRLIAIHFIREQRRFNKDILTSYRLTTTTITTSDTGETTEDFRSGIITNTDSESRTELGDPKNDPES